VEPGVGALVWPGPGHALRQSRAGRRPEPGHALWQRRTGRQTLTGTGEGAETGTTAGSPTPFSSTAGQPGAEAEAGVAG